MLKIKKGFTLAEMMVVMLIMSIILAAMAPVMTTRSKSDTSSPWRFSPNNSSDAYFGTGDAQVAMIGQPNRLETDDAARLIINASDVLKYPLSFKKNNTLLGHLLLDENKNIILGNTDIGANTGKNLSVFGMDALTSNTSGNDNTAIGTEALKSNTSGGQNTAIGKGSLISNTTGSNNVSIGTDALSSATDGSWNIAIGKNAYQKGTDDSNTIIGSDAMSKGTGNNNVALGTNALYYGSGNGNISIGANSNYKSSNLTTFTNSTAIGFSAYAEGANSVALGYGTNALGASSIAIGSNASATEEKAIAINSSATAKAAVAIGRANATAVGTLAISSMGGYGAANAQGEYSLAIGDSTASGRRAIAISAPAEETGLVSTNTAEGTSSIAIGINSHSNGSYSISMGSGAIAGEYDAVAIGAGTNAAKDSAVAIGAGSQAAGQNSISIGKNAISKSDNNIAIGENACSYVNGKNKICIGKDSGPGGTSISSWSSSSDTQERIFIGGKSKFNYKAAVLEVHNTTEKVKSGAWIYGGMNASGVVINGSLIVRGPIFAASRDNNVNIWDHSYNTTLGALEHYGSDPNNGVGDHYLVSRMSPEYINKPENFHPLVYNSSDRRLKYVGKEFNSGLDKIRQLKVYNYTFKKDKYKTPHVGVIAQDLQKIFPDAVKKAKNGFLTIRMEDMFYAMINAIKELDLKYQAQEKRINDLEKRIEKLEAKIK